MLNRKEKKIVELSGKTLNILDQVAKKPAGATKLTYTQPEGQDEAAQFLKLHRAADVIKVELEQIKETLIDVLTPWHEDQCGEAGKYITTVLVPLADGGVQLQFQKRFGKIPAAAKERLEAELGAGEFSRCFGPNVQLKLRKEVAEDPAAVNAVVRELVGAIGGEKFGRWFEAEQVLVPTEEFAEELAGDATLRQRLELKQIVVISEARKAA